ncbi:MAG: DUF3343 domain-containing protein [Zhaonellaceae bacterium]|jgi:hypothetical protein|nr:DUF3343 domain-containing protein [Clostridia bacterium]
MNNNYCVATFHSVHDALHFEKIVKAEGHKIRLIPVPREISSSCGISAKFSPELREQIEAIIKKEQLEVEGIYVLKEKAVKRNILDVFMKG